MILQLKRRPDLPAEVSTFTKVMVDKLSQAETAMPVLFGPEAHSPLAENKFYVYNNISKIFILLKSLHLINFLLL